MFIVLMIYIHTYVYTYIYTHTYKFIGAVNVPLLSVPERSVMRTRFSRQQLKGVPRRRQAHSCLLLSFNPAGPGSQDFSSK